MAETASATVEYLTGNLAFLAGGLSVEDLVGAFVKSIDDDGSAVMQRADGTEITVSLAASRISSGNAFPTDPAPKENDLHIFRVRVASGLTWKNTDGTSDLAFALAGDVAIRIGSNWVRAGSLHSPSRTLLAAVAGSSTAGVSTLTLPTDYVAYRNLTFAMWEVGEVWVKTIPTTLLGVVGTNLIGLYTLDDGMGGDTTFGARFTSSTRVLEGTGTSRIIYAVLED